MSMAGGKAAVVYFHCDKMITGLCQSHQVLKLILELGNTGPYLLKKVEENERVSQGLAGMMSMLQLLHPKPTENPYCRNLI